MCPRCKEGLEILEHAIRDYSVIQEVWSELNFEIQEITLNDTLQEWIREHLTRSSDQQKQLLFATIWAIWMGLNRVLHEKNTTISHRNWRVYNNERWTPPDQSITKINFDEAYNKQRKQLGTGIIFRSSKEENLGAKMLVNEGVLTPFAVEAIACLLAVQAGLEMGLRRVIIEGDALSVLRSSNGVAHELAKGAVEFLRSTDLGYWLPRKAMLALEEDIRSLTTLERDERLNRNGEETVINEKASQMIVKTSKILKVVEAGFDTYAGHWGFFRMGPMDLGLL
ncbi:hypothetical protein Goshw_029703, partial [Gossypium schwendimanii]|nr:hypothetical protein [Gossypium schwendimanii]